jgi:hypothetical protein
VTGGKQVVDRFTGLLDRSGTSLLPKSVRRTLFAHFSVLSVHLRRTDGNLHTLATMLDHAEPHVARTSTFLEAVE